MKVGWTNGNGDKRILVAHKASSINGFPGDGIDYTANSNFSTGTDLGNGNYVVYNGTGTSATVSNLEVGSTYYFRLFDYNNNTVTGNNSLYLRCNSTEASAVAGSALPVTLGFFTAKANGNASAVVQWQSLSEINSSYYEVERSTDALNFSTIGKVAAAGQSNVSYTYQFTDLSPANGNNYYRLKMVDKNGSAAYSKVVNVQFSKAVYNVYPKPAHNQLTIQTTAINNSKVDVQLIDVTGKTVLHQTLANETTQLDISKLAAGTYTVKIISDKSITVQKFTKL